MTFMIFAISIILSFFLLFTRFGMTFGKLTQARIIPLKKTSLLTALIMLVSLFANAQQWILKNPMPTNADLQDVYMINRDTGFVCGSYQTILKTTDGGITWLERGQKADNILYGITFNTPDTGFAVGWEGSILRTVDGGEYWTLMSQPFSSQPTDLFDVFFLDKNNGWICGNYYSVLRTQNGGVTWNVLTHNVGIDQEFDFIRFVSPDTGFVAGGMTAGQTGHLKKTTDGGVNWADIPIPAEIKKISGLEVLSSQELWIGAINQVNTQNGPATRVYHTLNGGSTWTSNDLVYTGPTVSSIKFFDHFHGRVLCEYRIYSTNDAGLTWHEQILSYDIQRLTSMYWPDSSKCILAGIYGYLFSSDNGGQNWLEQSHGTRASFSDIFFTGDQTGYAVGHEQNMAAIYRTLDGGNSWLKTPLDTTTSGHLNDVEFSDENNGWAVGYWGWILHTTDAGQTWVDLNSGFSSSYYAVNMYTSKFIWIGGYPCKMIRSVDYGSTWQDISLQISDYDVKKILFLDSLNGYTVLGKSYDLTLGKMFKTIDGGLNWIPIDFINTSNKGVLAISFPSVNEGYISIYNQGVAKTTDGGSTWQMLGKINGLVPSFIQFADIFKGIAGTGDNSMASTTDGGLTWNTLIYTIPSAAYITSYFFFPDLNHGWLSGWNGLIKQYNSTSTGISPSERHPGDGPVIYPNPAKEMLYFSYPENILQVKIFTTLGQLLRTTYGSDLKSINTRDIRPGLYFLQMSTGKKEFFVRFIKD